jgi:hypothetical protein
MGIKIAHFETGFNSTEHIPEKVLRYKVIKFLLTSIHFLCKFLYKQIKNQHTILHFFGVHIKINCYKRVWGLIGIYFYKLKTHQMAL